MTPSAGSMPRHRVRGHADAYPFPTLPAPLRFGMAAVLVGGVFLLEHFAAPHIDAASRLVLLGIAVMATAWFGGTGPALAATIVAAVLGAREIAGRTDEGAYLHQALALTHGLLLTAAVSELRKARREAEQRAREAQAARQLEESASRMKDEFLATISHELRTPLNAVLGWVHLLRTGKLDPATAARGLESIDRNVRLQAQLTADLLDVSKALTGKLQLNPRQTGLDEAARQAVAAVTPAATAKGVRVEAALPRDAVTIHGDPSRLRQIAWQLLANAIKFTPRGGAVEITVDTFGQDARLIVRDSGRGISPEFLPRIFDRFTQADSSPTRNAGGLGVGLALVRELVELHGGEIEARNRADGGGAIFIVRFPLQAAQTRPVEVPRLETAAPAGNAPFLEGLRVLVLDQEAEGRELLRTVLQQRGAIVQTVASVGEALDCLEGWRPDVLVSDSVAPEHDAYALVGKVQSLEAERGGRIPAAALSTVARSDERLRQMLAEVQREVPKPVEPAVLTSEIARLAGRERRRAQR
ncbi:MAG TPA: hybrid sensor histidine kinase/response regulator [Vicinamibacterales bacterium]|nr:hybrid sensor histidine kinase/response regulator [Vicinamibacterales bacterium]